MNEPPNPCRQSFVLSQQDFERFAGLSGDRNPIHIDPVFAARTGFGHTISHGMLLFSMVRSLVARTWNNSSLNHQKLIFPAPAYAGEPLELAIETLERDGNILTLRTTITRPDGENCLDGQCQITLSEESAA